jgi:hypothetical protein
VAEMTKSMLRLMNILSPNSSMIGVKTRSQHELLLWLAPRLVSLHHLVDSKIELRIELC